MQWRSLLALALAASYSYALLRFPCSQLVTERLDPLLTPGVVSAHLHQIVGGNAFNITMDLNNDLPRLSTCTTCRFKEDLSNYWTAVLFFKHPNGTYIRVPQMANQFTGTPGGGMTVYYIQPPNGQKVTAFKKGFRMIVGNAMVRNNTGSAESKALSFRCFNANFGSDASWPHPGTGPLDTPDLPKKACAGGIRSNIFFPSCWDGVTLDPPDHKSHVAYPVGTVPRDGLFFMAGSCPSTHPVRLPLLFTETVWDTRQFNNMWPTDGSQPFVYSMGDPTGFGQHADYVFGWDGDSLQRAMDQCTGADGVPENCRALTIRTDADINRCIQAPQVVENVGGYLPSLPGCNPIQRGPAQATMIGECAATPTVTGIPTAPPVPPPTTPTAAPTYVPPPPPPPPPPTGPTVPKWGQCGGIGWTGGTVCAAGSTCLKQNDWYSQCL